MLLISACSSSLRVAKILQNLEGSRNIMLVNEVIFSDTELLFSIECMIVFRLGRGVSLALFTWIGDNVCCGGTCFGSCVGGYSY